MARTKAYELRLPALEIRQGRRRRLYTFAVDGKQLPLFTTVSRVRREDRQIAGYQRPEVLAHVNAIRSYIESGEPLLPNAIVVAFDTRVRFPSDTTTRQWPGLVSLIDAMGRTSSTPMVTQAGGGVTRSVTTWC